METVMMKTAQVLADTSQGNLGKATTVMEVEMGQMMRIVTVRVNLISTLY